MSETHQLPIRSSGTELTRFNALRHGVLSRYTVLPWEDESEYQDLLSTLVSEHRPSGPTEEHLVEELAGILWRKRRLARRVGDYKCLGWSPNIPPAATRSEGINQPSQVVSMS